MSFSRYPTIRLSYVCEGDSFYECEEGRNAHMVALEDARLVDEPQRKGHACRVRLDSGEELELFEAHNAGGYGLRLYSMPMYGGSRAFN